MKRKFKAAGLQHVYDIFRNEDEQSVNYLRNSAVGNAFRRGLDGHTDSGPANSIAHAAWAAGADIRDREIHDEMDGSAAMNVPVEDLY